MQPKGTQFGNYTLERQEQEGLTSTFGEYRLLHHGEGLPHVAGVMHIRQRKGGPGRVEYPSGDAGIAATPHANRASHTGYDEGWARYTQGRQAMVAARAAQGRGEGAGPAHEAVMSSPHQIPLFHQEGQKSPASTVDALIMAQGHRHMASTLLGVAQNRSVATGAGDLRSPADLSRHSARLVSGMKDRGLLGSKVLSQRQNNITFEASQPTSVRNRQDEISVGEVRRGQSTMRALARRDRPRKAPEQGKLF